MLLQRTLIRRTRGVLHGLGRTCAAKYFPSCAKTDHISERFWAYPRMLGAHPTRTYRDTSTQPSGRLTEGCIQELTDSLHSHGSFSSLPAASRPRGIDRSVGHKPWLRNALHHHPRPHRGLTKLFASRLLVQHYGLIYLVDRSTRKRCRQGCFWEALRHPLETSNTGMRPTSVSSCLTTSFSIHRPLGKAALGNIP